MTADLREAWDDFTDAVNDPTWKYTHPKCFVVTGSRAEIERALTSWADDFGWRRPGPTLDFALEPYLVPPVHVEVSLDEKDDGTTVIFTALAPVRPRNSAYLGEGSPVGMGDFLQEVAWTFSLGVQARLDRQQGAAPLNEQSPEEVRLLRWERRRRSHFWPGMAFGPVALLVVLAVRGAEHYPAVVAGAILWLVAGYATYHYVRWWVLGALYGWILVLALLFWIGVVIAGGFALGG